MEEDIGKNLDNIGKETLISQAKEVFENIVNSSKSSLQDPTKIKEEITYLKQFLSKLKFQYLEQETRDKFLRLLLIDNKSISESDVEAIVAENARLKLSLKLLKREIEAVTEQGESMAEEVVNLNEQLKKQKADVRDDILEVAKLQAELDLLMSEGENENYKTLFNFKKLIHSDEVGLSEAISIASCAVENDEATLRELNKKIEDSRHEVEQKKSQLLSLEQRTIELESQAGEEQAPNLGDERQQYAQKLGDIKALLNSLAQAS